MGCWSGNFVTRHAFLRNMNAALCVALLSGDRGELAAPTMRRHSLSGFVRQRKLQWYPVHSVTNAFRVCQIEGRER